MFIYWIETESNVDRLVKIGITNNLPKRLSQHIRQSKSNLKYIWAIPVPDRKTALKIESELLKICFYAEFRSGTKPIEDHIEWFHWSLFLSEILTKAFVTINSKYNNMLGAAADALSNMEF